MKFYEEEWQRLKAEMGLRRFVMEFVLEGPSEDDVYTISTSAEGGRICGSNERSLLMGVYRFFYQLGVRYLGPGRKYEWFPMPSGEEGLRCDVRALVQQETVRPGYRHRGVCIEGADSEENILEMIDWLPKLGMNSFFVQFTRPDTFLNRWYHHVGNPDLPKEDVDLEAMDRRITEAMEKRGLVHHRVGHGWTGAVLKSTASGWEKEQQEIPENLLQMTAQIQGNRGLFVGVPLNTNLCMSNPQVQDRFVSVVADYAQEHPEVDCLHVWLADDFNNHCECEACRTKSPSDHYICIMNQLDAELTRRGLATRIVFLLYEELLWAPEQETLLHPERFILMFAPISRRFGYGYRDVKTLPQIPKFVLNRIALPTGVEENMAFLKEWQKIFRGDSFVYDYHLGRAHFGDPGYMHISRQLNEDIYALKGLGLNGMIACQELRAGFPHFLPNYVMGMTSTEPPFSFGDLEDEYFMAAYGPYAQEVMKYLETLSRLTDPDWFNGKGPRERADLLSAYEKALDLVLATRPSIEKMHAEHPLTEHFLDVLRYHSRFAELYLTVMIRRLNGLPTKEAAEAFCRLIREKEPEFQENLDVYRIQEVMRNYTKIDI